MKETGMSRKVDDLGRFVLPAEIRKNLGVAVGDSLEISVENERVVLSPVRKRCVFCASVSDLKKYRSRVVCIRCLEELSGAAQSSAEWEPFTES